MTDLPESPTAEQIETMRAIIDEHDRLAAADQIAAINAIYAPVADILKSETYADMVAVVADVMADLPSGETQVIMAMTNLKTALENLDATVRVKAAALLAE